MARIFSIKWKIHPICGRCFPGGWNFKLCSQRVYSGVTPVLVHISDLSQSLTGSGSYLYAYDMCIFYQDEDIHKTRCSKGVLYLRWKERHVRVSFETLVTQLYN